MQVEFASVLGEQVFLGDRPEYRRLQRLANPVHRRRLQKPDGGIWTAPLWMRGGRTSSPWIEWCRAQRFRLAEPRDVWKIVPSPESRLIVVDGAASFATVIANYRHRDSTSFLPFLDFESMREDGYAGLHVTERGYLECRHPIHGIDLFHWAVSSTIWFDWTFVDVVPGSTLAARP
ncbi:MAG TPA: hypothetical protein VFQ54_13045 [Thermomicrobiales bacterium]|nr:hypothetical protein [Thermomicrobiales bacterium]